MTKYILFGVVAVCALLGTVAFFGLTPFEKTVVVSQVLGSSAGASFGDVKVASQQVINASSTSPAATSTVFSALNTDSSSRVLIGADVALTGSGGATSTAYNIACATSTVASFNQGNTNFALNYTIGATSLGQFGTTTGNGMSFMSTTSPGVTGTTSPQYLASPLALATTQFARIWPSGTYLNCILTTSGGSTSNLLDGLVTGTISFPYRAQ